MIDANVFDLFRILRDARRGEPSRSYGPGPFTAVTDLKPVEVLAIDGKPVTPTPDRMSERRRL